MLVDQRNAGASLTTTAAGSFYAVDRTVLDCAGTSGTATLQRVADAPPGFTYSLRTTVLTTKTLSADDFVDYQQTIEGHNVSDLQYGSPTAKTTTLSFWVKSSRTGIFCATIFSNLTSRTYTTEYTINAGNTWQFVSVVIPGDTVGVISTQILSGISVRLTMAAGSGRQITARTWTSANAHGTVNQTNLFATVGATFQVTGIQLETGSVATEFDFLPYYKELALCQRYFERITFGTNSYKAMWASAPAAFFGNPIFFKVEKRVAPTIPTVTTGVSYWVIPGTTGVDAFQAHTFSAAGITTTNCYLTSPGRPTVTATNAGMYSWEGTLDLAVSAEF
jgi:hypothetical protein